jgi:hypothetical protein
LTSNRVFPSALSSLWYSGSPPIHPAHFAASQGAGLVATGDYENKIVWSTIDGTGAASDLRSTAANAELTQLEATGFDFGIVPTGGFVVWFQPSFLPSGSPSGPGVVDLFGVDGALKWRTSLDHGTDQSRMPIWAEQRSDGSFTLLIDVVDAAGTRLTDLARLSSDGTVASDTRLPGAWYHLHPSGDGGALLVGNDEVMRLASDGTQVWKVSAPGDLKGVIAGTDGGTLIATALDPSTTVLSLAKLDAQGNQASIVTLR